MSHEFEKLNSLRIDPVKKDLIMDAVLSKQPWRVLRFKHRTLYTTGAATLVLVLLVASGFSLKAADKGSKVSQKDVTSGPVLDEVIKEEEALMSFEDEMAGFEKEESELKALEGEVDNLNLEEA